MKRILSIGVLAVNLVVCLTSLAKPATAAVISVGPYTTSTTMPFVVPITITGAIDLASFSFDLAYDAADVAIATACDPFGDAACDFVTGPITLGSFYTASAMFPPLLNPGFVLLDPFGAQVGQLVGLDGAWQDPGPAPSGDGILAFIEFVVVDGGSGHSPITIVGADSPGTPIPEPATVALLFAGLALGSVGTHAARRRSRAQATR